MTRLIQGVFVVAAGVLVAAGILDVLRAIEPPAIWPWAVAIAGALLIVANAMETPGGA